MSKRNSGKNINNANIKYAPRMNAHALLVAPKETIGFF
jgi:hypothetical protein